MIGCFDLKLRFMFCVEVEGVIIVEDFFVWDNFGWKKWDGFCFDNSNQTWHFFAFKTYFSNLKQSTEEQRKKKYLSVQLIKNYRCQIIIHEYLDDIIFNEHFVQVCEVRNSWFFVKFKCLFLSLSFFFSLSRFYRTKT